MKATLSNFLRLILLCSAVASTDCAQEEMISEQELAQQPAVKEIQQVEKSASQTSGASINGAPIEVRGTHNFDIEAKRKQVLELIQKGINFAQKNDIAETFNLFTHSKDFVKGELYLFAYTMDGICLAHGQEAGYVWQDMSDLKDAFGNYIVKSFIKTAQEGGGWNVYEWRNATKVSYIKSFEKLGKKYIIGCGYYPHSKPDAVQSLVKGAAAYFNDVVDKKRLAPDEAFSTISYPFGRFVLGDLYLYAVRFDGTMMANGDRPGLIGTNVLNVRDSEGKLVNQEIMNKLHENPDGIWIEYRSKGARKLAYAERVVDNKGQRYFIACGYYPDADRSQLVNLVKNGYEFMKKHGLSAAEEEFTGRSDDYRFGDLYLFVYTLKGKCLAHGKNPDYVGMNQWDFKDEDGRYFVREMIEKAKKGGGWIDFKIKNAFMTAYVELVDLGVSQYVIGSNLFPVSKHETASLLVRSAAGYLRDNQKMKAFGDFTNPKGSFIRGDLSVFVIGFDGICRVYGDIYELIWRNLLGVQDDSGKEYVQLFINTSRQGAGQVTYIVNGAKRIALVEMVEKDGQSFVVGTGYYA